VKGTFLALAADGKVDVVQGTLGLQEIYEYTNGGPIQMVEVPVMDDVTPRGLALFCNEEGKLRQLPVNDGATSVCDAPSFNDFIVGDVLFWRSRDARGRLLEDGDGLTSDQLNWLQGMVS
jgi:hypothetical protein